MAKIEELTGIRRSQTQVRPFLKSLGMRRLKLGAIRAKADPEKQAILKKEVLDPRLADEFTLSVLDPCRYAKDGSLNTPVMPQKTHVASGLEPPSHKEA